MLKIIRLIAISIVLALLLIFGRIGLLRFHGWLVSKTMISPTTPFPLKGSSMHLKLEVMDDQAINWWATQIQEYNKAHPSSKLSEKVNQRHITRIPDDLARIAPFQFEVIEINEDVLFIFHLGGYRGVRELFAKFIKKSEYYEFYEGSGFLKLNNSLWLSWKNNSYAFSSNRTLLKQLIGDRENIVTEKDPHKNQVMYGYISLINAERLNSPMFYGWFRLEDLFDRMDFQLQQTGEQEFILSINLSEPSFRLEQEIFPNKEIEESIQEIFMEMLKVKINQIDIKKNQIGYQVKIYCEKPFFEILEMIWD